jgi:hypothetical protein
MTIPAPRSLFPRSRLPAPGSHASLIPVTSLLFKTAKALLDLLPEASTIRKGRLQQVVGLE